MLAGVQDDLREKFPKNTVRWMHPDDTHCTLTFLGNTSEDKINAIKPLLYGLARRQASFQLETSSLDCFPNRNKPNIVYAAVRGQLNGLSQLQQHTASSMESLGFQPEKRRYTPHLTLARVARSTSKEDRAAIGEICGEYWFELEVWEATSISLWLSSRTDDGPRYTAIETVPFRHG